MLGKASVPSVRSCLGQTISQWQIFLFLTAILQKFNVSLSGDVKPDVYGLIRFQKGSKVSFKLRESSAFSP
ncbi:hypothetical protein EB796_004956 [Bugula neritina]|uniref:Uncharacterized protein n=1 Tax=Bugula neritina TaxID=10212 RepID=A0A7J7KES3_BUGNE|nr:hypothetical protein EB796_004956 [Bugula neritina]